MKKFHLAFVYVLIPTCLVAAQEAATPQPAVEGSAKSSREGDTKNEATRGDERQLGGESKNQDNLNDQQQTGEMPSAELRVPLPNHLTRTLADINGAPMVLIETALVLNQGRPAEILGIDDQAQLIDGGLPLGIIGEVHLADGRILTEMDRLATGDVVKQGFFRNASRSTLYLVDAESGELFELPPFEIGAIGTVAAGCSVGCGSGHYACCKPISQGGCQCKPNATQEACIAGGPGSTWCTYTN